MIAFSKPLNLLRDPDATGFNASMAAIEPRRFTDEFVYNELTDDELTLYRKEGYLLLGQVLTERGLELMCEQSMVAWNTEMGEFNPGETWLQNALLPNVHRLSELVRRYFFYGPLVDVAERLVGSNIKATSSQLTFKCTVRRFD